MDTPDTEWDCPNCQKDITPFVTKLREKIVNSLTNRVCAMYEPMPSANDSKDYNRGKHEGVELARTRCIKLIEQETGHIVKTVFYTQEEVDNLISSRDTYWRERVRKEVEKMKKKSVCRNPAHGKESHTCENTVRNKVLTDIVEFIIRDKTNGL